MSEFKFMVRCFMCGSEFQMGPHRYDGKHIPRYKIDVCRACYDGNWDGWAPHCEERLIEHLEKEGISIPKRNKRGWIPRD
jgi:hypothetical protein